MSYDNKKVAHELFYMKESRRDSFQGSNMRIERANGYTVAYSYFTPIAVYPDKGGYVLLDSYWYSSSTSKHQAYIRQAIPADVEPIAFSWLGCNRKCWAYYRSRPYNTLLKEFLDAVEQRLDPLAKDCPNSYVYARERNAFLAELQALHRFFSRFGRKRAVRSVERKMAYINDPKRIKAGQQHCAAERAERRRKVMEQQREQRLADGVAAFFRRREDVRSALKERVEHLMNAYPLEMLKDFHKIAGSTVVLPVGRTLVNKVSNVMNGLLQKQ